MRKIGEQRQLLFQMSIHSASVAEVHTPRVRTLLRTHARSTHREVPVVRDVLELLATAEGNPDAGAE